jgi:hypothetical protein
LEEAVVVVVVFHKEYEMLREAIEFVGVAIVGKEWNDRG